MGIAHLKVLLVDLICCCSDIFIFVIKQIVFSPQRSLHSCLSRYQDLVENILMIKALDGIRTHDLRSSPLQAQVYETFALPG